MRQVAVELTVTLIFLAPLVVAAAAVAALLALTGWADDWRWQHWLIASPLLYLGCLLLMLVISAAICRMLGARYPKPRYAAPRRGAPMGKNEWGLLTAWVCYRRALLVHSLPLVPLLSQFGFLQALVLHAYAPSVHVGRRVLMMGVLHDPDLIDIGDDVVLGAGSTVTGHAMSVRADRTPVLVTAPVRIGARATIGGNARVDLGCQIGEDVMVEPGSIVEPFTRIPPGEVWGGNPAAFHRKRSGLKPSSDTLRLPEEADLAAPEVLRQLVQEALALRSDELTGELSSDTCAAWDSMGKMAIAAAVFDRFGVSIDAREVLEIRSLDGLADILARAGVAVPGLRHDTSTSRSGSAVPGLASTGSPGVPNDPELLPLLDPVAATQVLAARFHAQQTRGQPLRVVIASTFTAQPLLEPMRLWGRAFGLELDGHVAAYDQLVQTLLDDDGPFATNTDGVNVVLARPEDLITTSAQPTAETLDQIIAALARFGAGAAARGQQLVVGTLPPVVSAFHLLDAGEVDTLRHAWRSRLEVETPGITLFEASQVVEHFGLDAARNSPSEVLTRAPYSARLYQALGIALVRHMRATRRSPAKVVAVDCDNLLWGGVVGEVGVAGIALGADGPGRSFQLLQRHLKWLKDRGVLLAVVSKNEARDVREVFEHHPEMVLRPNDIAAWRVNWNHKSASLREVSVELNLALDSFVLLDDDPAVRAEVEASLPEVHVVPLPPDSTEYCATLGKLWLFDGLKPTEVDLARTRMAHDEATRQHERTAAASLETYLASLDLEVDISAPTERDWPRAAQLTQRTNQFNLALKRRTPGELRALGAGSSVLLLRARDRFGDYGPVGLGILGPTTDEEMWEIDTFLLSCRALGRGVEDAFLHGLAELASSRGAGTLVAPYVLGSRNGQVVDFLARVGFHETTPNRWERSLVSIPPLPGHARLTRGATLDPAGIR